MRGIRNCHGCWKRYYIRWCVIPRDGPFDALLIAYRALLSLCNVHIGTCLWYVYTYWMLLQNKCLKVP